MFKERQHYNKELIKLGFSASAMLVYIYFFYNVMKIRNHHNKKSEHICFVYDWSKMLPSSLDALLKLSKMTFPQKLFDYDCKTLYVFP